MYQITRYILIELLKVFAITLIGMTLLMMLVGVVQEALRQGLGPIPILKLIPYILPNALRFAVPGTILFAACSVYGRMSAANEIVAMKALGISPMSTLWPALSLAFFISLVTVWLNDIAVSWGRTGVNRVVIQSVEQIAYGMLRTQRSYSSNHFSIDVKRVEGRKLMRVTLSFRASESSPAVVLTAREAEMRFNPEKEELTIYLTDGEFDVGDGTHGVHGVFPDTIERAIPLSAASRKGKLVRGPSDLALREIPDEIQRQREEIRQLEMSLAATAAYQMLSGEFDELTSTSWKSRRESLRYGQSRLFRLYTEPWRRWANGFSCFFFVLLGAPLAVRLRNADLWTSFAICFMPILLLYYPLLMYGVDRAKCGALPPYFVWTGNVVLLLAGCWLIRKMMRY